MQRIIEDAYPIVLPDDTCFVLRPVAWPDYQRGYQDYALALSLSGSIFPDMADPAVTGLLQSAFESWGIPIHVFQALTVPQVYDLVLNRPEVDDEGEVKTNEKGEPIVIGSYLFQLNQIIKDRQSMKADGDKIKKKLSKKELTSLTSRFGSNAPGIQRKIQQLGSFLSSRYKSAST